MKKNVFALSVAAALAAFAGSASAQYVTTADATKFEVNAGGIGHIQLIPYFTVQNNNNTLLNVVNTDTVNGKAVKVRFRGARNSDDVFDFYVLLSPGDVWRTRVYQDEAGNTRLDLNGDTSCTYPENAVVQATAFPTGRVFEGRVAETQAGYVELLTAANIPQTLDGTAINPLYKAIKHVNGVAPCLGADGANVIDAAFAAPFYAQGITIDGEEVLASTPEDANAKGFFAPTTGLIANWAVMNVATGSTASGNGTALQAVNDDGVDAKGNIVVSPQDNVTAPADYVVAGTADPLLAQGKIQAAYYDFPDLSTPYLQGVTDPGAQANSVSSGLAVSRILNELTTVEAGFRTDWVLTLPTRRYGVAVDYAAAATTAGANNYLVFSNGTTTSQEPSVYFTTNNATTNKLDGVPGLKISVKADTYWDKEENSSSSRGGAVISPGVPGSLPYFPGEANVFTFNGMSADSILGGALAYNEISPKTAQGAAITSGWAGFDLARAAASTVYRDGLPVIGYATMTAGNGINLTYPHRFK